MHRPARVVASALSGLLLLTAAAACSGGGGSDAAPATRPPASSTPSTVPATLPPPVTAPPVPATVTPTFASTVSPVTAAELGASWREGCPVGPDSLRRLALSYWDFDGQPRTGALVVHADVADAVTGVFRRLFEQRFPVRRMETIDTYNGSDDASMDANNTSGFNCRPAVTSGPPQWSVHSFGKAIDVNPVENPYVFAGRVLPPAATPYVDRANVRPGMAFTGGPLVDAFAAAGWQWGGRWAGSPDYQHFSATGG